VSIHSNITVDERVLIQLPNSEQAVNKRVYVYSETQRLFTCLFK